MAALPLPFRLGHLLFLFLAWLLWLGLPVLCWMGVVRVSILVVFQNSVEQLSAFHCWVLRWLWVYFIMFPLYTVWWEFFFFLSKMDVEFYQMFFLCPLRWSCSFCFFHFTYICIPIFWQLLQSGWAKLCCLNEQFPTLSAVTAQGLTCRSRYSGSVYGTTQRPRWRVSGLTAAEAEKQHSKWCFGS